MSRLASHGAAAGLGIAVLVLAGAGPASGAQPPRLPGALRPLVAGGGSPRFAEAAGTTPDWLATINYWRQSAGLAPVSDEPAWDVGIQHHLTYLEDTPASYMTGQYASKHTENPQSPYYTAGGATEGGDSDLEWGVHTDLDAINGWLTAPFHAIGMLRAQLTQVAFARDSAGYAGLDVIQGLDQNGPAATSPILFPGPGSTTTLPTASTGELPDPLETCGWQGTRAGLPLIALLTQPPATTLTASLSGPTGPESTSGGSLCLVDENTYQSSDPVYGPTGRSILQGDNAVFLIPRAPLADGTYSVDIQQPNQPDVAWSFTASIPAPANVSPPAIGGYYGVGATLTAYHGQWTNFPTTYAEQWMRCDATGSGCSPISGATGSTYLLQGGDAGDTIRVQEIASNSGGPSSPAVSSPIGPVYDSTVTFGPPTPSTPSPPPTPSTPSPPVTSAGSKPQPCALCVTRARPVAFAVPSTVAPHHTITVRLVGIQRFTVTITVSTVGGHRLWRRTRRLAAGHRVLRIVLPRADTGRGRAVLVNAQFTLGARRITLRRTIRFG